MKGCLAELIPGEWGRDFGEGAYAEGVLEGEYVFSAEAMAFEEGDALLEAGERLLECGLLNFHYNR